MKHSLDPRRVPEHAPMVCTVLRDTTGGYVPVVHPPEDPCPTPNPFALTFPTAPEAALWAKNHYGVSRVTVIASTQPAA